MMLSLKESTLAILICAFVSQTAALSVDEAAKTGSILLNATCPHQPLTLIDENSPPWAYFRVINKTSPGDYAIELKQPVDTGYKSTNCWPQDTSTWTHMGRYKCDGKERQEIITIGSVINNYSPSFCTRTRDSCNNITSFSVTVNEGMANVSTTIATISLCDMDVFKTSSENYKIDTKNTHLRIVSQIGDSFGVQLAQPYTYNASDSQQLATITVSDEIHPPYPMDFIITVQDVDDQGPEFSQTVYQCKIPEANYTRPNLTSCSVRAEDKDKEIRAAIGYKVLQTNTGGVNFNVTSAGQIEVHGNLDREKQASYIVPVKGFQKKRPADRFDIATVVITVTDIDDHKPKFTNTQAKISIMENTQNGALIYQFTATDQDEGANAVFKYRLVDTRNAFTVDIHNGKVTVKNSTKLDRETVKSAITIVVYADPGGIDSPSNPRASGTIELLDVNDNSPQFTEPAYNKTILKTKLAGEPIFNITANDPDEGENGRVIFSFIEDGSPFAISKSGEVTLKSSISEKFKDVYHLMVKAEDQASKLADRRSTSMPVTIHVRDVNIHFPAAVILDHRAVSEDANSGTPVAWLNVTDMDPSDTITVAISSGNVGGAFLVEQSYLSVYSVKVKKALDRETYPFYRLNISCYDTRHTTYIEVNVTILDENDNHPTFSPPYNFTITENLKAKSVIGTTNATDKDEGENANVSLFIDPETRWFSNFTIGKTSGIITTLTSLDREVLGEGDSLQFIVYGVDHGLIPLTGSTTVTVMVQDVNDNPPVFEQTNVTLSVKELYGPGFIHTAKASDKDIGRNKVIVYSIRSATPNSSDLFEISPSDGKLSTKRPITFADTINGTIRLEILASNPGNQQTPTKQDVKIHIDDVNNHVPKFGLPKYNTTISETTEPGTSIIRITASDADVSPINNKATFRLDGPSNDTFRIDPSSGEVFLVKNIDLDIKSAVKQHSFKVLASDDRPFFNGSSALDVSVPLDISVSYENEYDPVFSRVMYYCSVNESYTGTFGCTVHADDKDMGNDGKITYRILNNNKLTINTTSGEFGVNSSLDYVRDRKLRVNVSATDGGSPISRTAYCTVTIEVIRVNKGAPQIAWTRTKHLYVVEGAKYERGTRIAVIPAVDRDGNDGKALKYSLDLLSSQLFSIRDGGVISLKEDTTFDYEKKPSYVLEVSVKDDVHPAVKMNITLDVINVNEFQPVITSLNFIATEGSTSTVQILAHDNDSGSYGNITFRLADATLHDNVSITAGGSLTVTNLDREALGEDGVFTVPVLAMDGGNLTTMADIKIKVTGINDNPPYFLNREKHIERMVNEKTIYLNLFKSVAKDDDIGEGSAILYRLKTGDGNIFSVSQGGLVSIKSKTLSATNGSVTIEIEAYNHVQPELTATQNITFTIEDINDNIPRFVPPQYRRDASECLSVGSIIGAVHAIDLDINPAYRTVTYWMDNKTNVFSVDAKTGEVYIRQQLDYDNPTERAFHLTIYATDSLDKTLTTSNHTTSTDVIVNVTSCNDNTPIFSDEMYYCSVNELYTGTFGCSVSATDKDSDRDGDITFTIINNTKLTVDHSSGELRINNSFNYDNPADREIVVNVSATDGGSPPRSSFTTVRVEVKRVNKIAPNITWDVRKHLSVVEGVTFPNGTQIGTIPVIDDDGNDDKPLIYTLDNNSKSMFALKDGIISLNRDFAFDFETQSNYVLEMSVKDDAHPVVTKYITLDVINMNEFQPVFTTLNFTVTEGGTKTVQISTTDADKGTYGNVTLRLADSTIGNVTLTPRGQLTITNIDRDVLGEDGVFTVPVMAMDGGNLTTMANIKIKVIGINDNAPKFNRQEYRFSVIENADVGYVGEVSATDKDGDGITYSSRKNKCPDLTILGNGTIVLQQPLDYEIAQSCSMTVYANDSLYSSSVEVRVDVLDVNDNYPQFSKKSYSIHINETSLKNKKIVQVSASDADGSAKNNKIIYTILGGNTDNTFHLDAKTGWITNTKTLDASVRQSYSLVVEANDNGAPSLSNVTVVSIVVEDVNNNKPVFLNAPYKVQITENSTEQVLFKVIAHDADPGTNLTLHVVSTPYREWFYFNGTYFCAKTLDAEQIKKHVIDVPIEVSDGHFKENTSVSVTITDINDNTPYFLNPSQNNIHLSDTTLVGTEVFNITANDSDVTNSGIMYLLSYNYGFFEIDQTSGNVTLQRTLDAHKYKIINLTVTAIDSGSPPKSAKTQIIIDVLETNKYTPTFLNGSNNQNVFEIDFVEEKPGQFSVISAYDNDTGPAGAISYSIKSPIGTFPSSFNFDRYTGMITLTKSIDFETDVTREFTFLIIAKDNATFSKSATATAVIHITDKDEAPKFAKVTDIVYKELNASAGSIITTVTVTDPDVAEHFRNFTFTLSPSGYFKIERQSGESDKAIIKAATTLSKSGTYNITVTVTDGGGLSDTASVTIQVSNITGLELRTNILEGLPPPVVLMDLLKSTNLSSNTWFSLVKSNDSNNFKILQNGSFIANKKFDRELKPEFKVEIKGHKNLSGEVILTAQIQMHVTVLDVNDETPTFNRSIYNIFISEDTSTGTTITTVTASDNDESSKLSYSFNPPSATFRINSSNGEISLIKAVDYERNTNNYSLTVVCNDTVNTAQATLIITVTDKNDVTPKFTNTSYTFRISENQSTGPIQGIFVNATDPDTDDQGNLTYSILTGTTDAIFKESNYFGYLSVSLEIRVIVTDPSPVSIDASGQLRLKAPLDYDTMAASKTVVVTAQVADTAGQKSNTSITIIVLDANDNAPNFTKPDYYYHVPEGTKMLGYNFSVQASDIDSGNNAVLTFSLKGANMTLFNITTKGDKCYIHVIHALDRESLSGDHDVNGSAVYVLTVLATDHGDKPQTASALVHITVDDVNDCPPVFPSSNLSASVQEGTAIGTIIMTVTTSDCDLLQKYKQVTYSLETGSSDAFNITSTGDISVQRAVSVKEQEKYILKIIASDGKHESKANLVVTILDANDHSPNFTLPVYTFSVSENVVGVKVGEVLAVDEDPGENGNVTYDITSGNTGNVFDIEKINMTGIINLRSSVSLDRETIPSYTLIVTAEDSAKTGSRQGTCTVTVHVNDVNDNRPKFGRPGGYEGSVKEDATNGTLVQLNAPISATDSDNGINGTYGIIYSLLPTNQSQFCINNTTGAVLVCGALDRETTAKYSVQVVARDNLGDPHSTSASANLTIIVADVNDKPPEFVSTPYSYIVHENATSGTSVGTVTVTDADDHGLQTVRIRIASGSHDNFYIDTNQNETVLTGTIFVSGVLDREERPSYRLIVVANDAGRDSSNTTVNIDILDVNDNAPVFNESSIEIDVVEQSNPGIIYNVTAYDLDQPNTNNSDIVFHFDQKTISDFGSYFGIDERGSIFTRQELDRENMTTSTCSLSVIASDKGQPPRNTSKTITVHVLDVNDNSPKFCDTPPCTNNSFVVETQPVGSIIALPVATDPDKGENGTIVYSILKTNASKYFKIDSETGLVRIAQPILINTLIGEKIVNNTGDNETVTVEVIVVATDKGPDGGRKSNLTLNVKIEPINDNAPIFKDPCDFHITEERPPGTFVGDCEAIIPNATFSHLTYTLIAGFDNSLFNINKLNGTIRATARLDRELTSHYSLSVQVKDGRTPERTAFAAVTITVDDINDNSPEFLHGPFSFEVPENSATWPRTINASAMDPDEGRNGSLKYTIDNNYDGKFHINESSGVVTVNGTFNYEQMTHYIFHVNASDNGRTPRTSSALVNITVIDVNDNAPVFHGVRPKYNVNENQTGTIFTINATDRDSGYNGRVVYSIKDTDGGPFSIGPFDGRVFVEGHLDYETKSEYNLSFEATDQGLEPLSTVVNVTLAVIDVYDNLPKFPKDLYEVYLDAGVAVGATVADLTIGKKGIQYNITGGDSSLFSINSTSGVVTVGQQLGSHNRQDLVTVTATDSRGQTAKTTLIVHVNNHEVMFPEKEIEVRLLENFNGSTLLCDLNTAEEQSGQDVTYSITGIEPNVQGVFRIESRTGAVYCDKALDREVHGEYVIHIAAVVSSPDSHRAKREVKDWSSAMRLRVHIDDVNDNQPTFVASQKTLFGVPADAKANYLVTVLQAYDPDLGDNGRVFYTASAGNTNVFGVDRNTGSVTTLVAIASHPDVQNFTLTVTAKDESGETGPHSTLELTILVVHREDRLMLQINMSTSQFRQKQAFFIGNMSNLLGVDVQVERIESHREKTTSGTSIDLSRTDMFFHGVNETTGLIVPFDAMMELINEKNSELSSLFGNKVVEVTQMKKVPYVDPSAITVPIIALFCVAIIIFLGSFIAVVLTLHSWTRMNKQRELLEKRRQARDVKMSDFEMDTLRSRASKHSSGEPGGGAGAVNPVFLETEFVARSEKPKPKKIDYETQELRLQFTEEPLRFSDETLDNNGNGARSVADSALENTSLTSNDQLRSEASSRPNGNDNNGEVLTSTQADDTGLNGGTMNGDTLNANTFGLKAGEGPMMTSSPRISKDYDAEGKIAILGQGATSRLATPNLRLSIERLDGMDKSRETDTDVDLVDEKDENKAEIEDYKKSTPGASTEISSKKPMSDPTIKGGKEGATKRAVSFTPELDKKPGETSNEQGTTHSAEENMENEDDEITSF